MKNFFANQNLLNCHAVSHQVTNRFVYEWGEVKAFNGPNEKLEGWPNPDADKFKKKTLDKSTTPPTAAEVQTEDINTPEGRNIIRGQAVMFLKHYPYESGDPSKAATETDNPGSDDLNSLVSKSRKAELGIKVPDGNGNLVALDKVQTATDLKRVLDLFREKVVDKTDPANPKFKAPNKIEDFNNVGALPEGRNWVRTASQDWLNKNPETAANKDKRDTLKNALKVCLYTETGEFYRIAGNPTQFAKEFPGATLPDFAGKKPEEIKEAKDTAKWESANALKAALDAAKA